MEQSLPDGNERDRLVKKLSVFKVNWNFLFSSQGALTGTYHQPQEFKLLLISTPVTKITISCSL